MIRKTILLTAVILGILPACNSIPYKDDIGFMSSAQAGSHEFPITVNGKACKDLDGQVGACLKQLASNEALVVELPARPYAYRLDVRCSMVLGADFPVDVQAGKSHRVEIKPEQFAEFLSWTCTGEVTPYDRDQRVSAKWHVRVLVKDAAYQGREEIYTVEKGSKRRYAILGAFARYATVCDDKGCDNYDKKTVVGIQGGLKAFSESEVMRFNYLGW